MKLSSERWIVILGVCFFGLIFTGLIFSMNHALDFEDRKESNESFCIRECIKDNMRKHFNKIYGSIDTAFETSKKYCENQQIGMICIKRVYVNQKENRYKYFNRSE